MNQRSDAPSATLGRQELIRELEQLAANDGMTHQHAAHVHLHVKLIKPIVEALRSERAPSGMAMLAELSPTRLEAKLESLRANAVMSKFATVRECQAYRRAVEDVLEMVRQSHPITTGNLTEQREIADRHCDSDIQEAFTKLAPVSARATTTDDELDAARYRWLRNQAGVERAVEIVSEQEGLMMDHHIDKGLCGL